METDRGLLVAVCGVPGVGKTTVAERIAERVEGTLIRTDVVRKELFAQPTYTEAESRAVYDELFRRARASLEAGGRPVLDATFTRTDERERGAAIAETCDAEWRLVHVVADAGDVTGRIEAREGDESDATVAVHEQFKETFDAPADPYCRVDNSGDLAATYEQVDALF